MNWYSLTAGIEHLFTGITFHPSPESAGFQFQRESASIVRVFSDKPFYAVWNQRLMDAQPSGPPKQWPLGSVDGPADFYAKVTGPAMQLHEQRLYDAQTFSRKHEWTDRNGTPSRYAPGEPDRFPECVVTAMVRKHGARAHEYLCKLRWAGDHWFYTDSGMYIGVEPDGYIHT